MSAPSARLALLPGFRPGDRHGWLEQFCDGIEQMLLARAARALLDAGPIPATAALAVLPCWSWVVPAPGVGRKARARGGQGSLLLPARTVYDTGPLVLLGKGEKVPVAWSYTGVGRSAESVLVLRAVTHTVTDLAFTNGNGPLPERGEATLLPRAHLTRRLTAIVESGEQARWDLLTTLERSVAQTVASVHRAVVAEVNDVDLDTTIAKIRLDTADLEAITTRLTYGTPGEPAEASKLSRLIAKIAAPGTLDRVDPLRYLTVNLHRDVEEAIRQRIGDPHIGPKIRKIARSMPGASPEQMLAAYRRRYPADRLGEDRLNGALSLPEMATVHVPDPSRIVGRGAVVADHADEVIERIDLVRAVARRRGVTLPAFADVPVVPAPGPAAPRGGQEQT